MVKEILLSMEIQGFQVVKCEKMEWHDKVLEVFSKLLVFLSTVHVSNNHFSTLFKSPNLALDW